MGQVRVNLTLTADVVQTARALGHNMSRLAEAAIAQGAKIERNRLWRAENRSAISAYTVEAAKEGLPLPGLRRFQDRERVAQFVLYLLKGGPLVVDLQTDLIGIETSHVVAPLRAAVPYIAPQRALDILIYGE
jgi:antitoxin CcdA